MNDSLRLSKLEDSIFQDPNFLFTFVSYFLALIIYTNLNTVQSPILGLAASALYFLINGIFLGRVFFEKEAVFFRLSLGILLLILLLGFVGWLAVIIYNLDVIRLTLVLLITTTFSSLLNKKVKKKNVA